METMRMNLHHGTDATAAAATNASATNFRSKSVRGSMAFFVEFVELCSKEAEKRMVSGARH